MARKCLGFAFPVISAGTGFPTEQPVYLRLTDWFSTPECKALCDCQSPDLIDGVFARVIPLACSCDLGALSGSGTITRFQSPWEPLMTSS